MPDLMTSGQAAEVLGIHRETVCTWSNEGKLPAAYRTAGGHRRFRVDVVRTLQRARDGVCGICAGDAEVTCSSCDGACVTAAGLMCPDCGGVGVVTPVHCCGCGMTGNDGACSCPPDE